MYHIEWWSETRGEDVQLRDFATLAEAARQAESVSAGYGAQIGQRVAVFVYNDNNTYMGRAVNGTYRADGAEYAEP